MNKSAVAAQNFGDIFYLRERMIQDILHKNNLEKIKSRVSDIHNNKPKKKKKLKKKKKGESNLILPTILENNYLNSEEENSSEENYGKKPIFSLGNSPRIFKTEDYGKRYKESKRRIDMIKLQEIQKENEFFVQKLQNVNSPLNKNLLNNSYEKVANYKNIAKNTKTIKEVQKKADNVKDHLPPIIFDKKIPFNYIYSTHSLDSMNINAFDD